MTNKIDSSLVGELILGEQTEWYVGVCTVTYDSMENNMIVFGENSHVIGTVSTGVWTTESVAQQVNELIEAEHAKL